MTNNVKQEEIAKEIIRIFHGGIHGKGKDGNGYPTYFEKPYYLWVEDRLPVVTSLINQQVIQALERARDEMRTANINQGVHGIFHLKVLTEPMLNDLIKEYKGE